MAEERTESNRPPLRAEVDVDQQLILVVDGSGELLALTYDEAVALVSSLRDVLDLVR